MVLKHSKDSNVKEFVCFSFIAGASTSVEKVKRETPLNVVEGEEAFSSVDVEVLKEGPPGK